MLNIYDFNKLYVQFNFNPKARQSGLGGKNFCHTFDIDGIKLTQKGEMEARRNGNFRPKGNATG